MLRQWRKLRLSRCLRRTSTRSRSRAALSAQMERDHSLASAFISLISNRLGTKLLLTTQLSIMLLVQLLWRRPHCRHLACPRSSCRQHRAINRARAETTSTRRSRARKGELIRLSCREPTTTSSPCSGAEMRRT